MISHFDSPVYMRKSSKVTTQKMVFVAVVLIDFHSHYEYGLVAHG